MTSKKQLILIIVFALILINVTFLIYQKSYQRGNLLKSLVKISTPSPLDLTNHQLGETPTSAQQKEIEKITLPLAITLEQAQKIVEDWIESQPTYKFDGQNLTLKNAIALAEDSYRFLYNFETKRPGYGNRSKEKVEKTTTPHLIEVTTQNNRILYALIDGRWDEVEQKMIR